MRKTAGHSLLSLSSLVEVYEETKYTHTLGKERDRRRSSEMLGDRTRESDSREQTAQRKAWQERKSGNRKRGPGERSKTETQSQGHRGKGHEKTGKED